MTFILLLAALILFLLAAFGAKLGEINLVALGLACLTGSMLL